LLQHNNSYMSPSIQENVSLQEYNTFGINVKARLFATVASEKALQDLLQLDEAKNTPILVLGGGSNILFTTEYAGLVIKMGIEGIDVSTTDDKVYVTAGAGVVWNDLVLFCVQNGYAGLENLTLIPGTVGASPIQNIGAYGVELKDVFHSCTAIEISTGVRREFHYEDCDFGYRESVFKEKLKGKYIITSVCFCLSKLPALQLQYGALQTELERRSIARPTIADVSKVVAEIRVSKLPDPSTIGNAGSFFKNPIVPSLQYSTLRMRFPDVVGFPAGPDRYKVAAGWLIEQCGFKGIVDGHTGTWKNQALVLVNHGGATGLEVFSFSERIISSVFVRFGITLEREVNIL
jgi:UDP-N-acetylmuramate dehydrogenase